MTTVRTSSPLPSQLIDENIISTQDAYVNDGDVYVYGAKAITFGADTIADIVLGKDLSKKSYKVVKNHLKKILFIVVLCTSISDFARQARGWIFWTTLTLRSLFYWSIFIHVNYEIIFFMLQRFDIAYILANSIVFIVVNVMIDKNSAKRTAVIWIMFS